MPNTISTDWDKVRVRCTVIGSVRPGSVSFESEPQEIEFDEDLIHWDAIYPKMIGVLGGMSSELSGDFVPLDLHRPNSVFWLTIGNDGRLRLFRRAEDETPAVLGTRDGVHAPAAGEPSRQTSTNDEIGVTEGQSRLELPACGLCLLGSRAG